MQAKVALENFMRMIKEVENSVDDLIKAKQYLTCVDGIELNVFVPA